MSWRLEAWNPEYALPERLEEGEGLEGLKTHYEGDWVVRTPQRQSASEWPVVYLVDGRQRVDAQIADSRGRQALLATVVAGAVVRDAAGIRPVGEPLKRHILLHSGDLEEPLPPGLSHYQPVEAKRADPASMRSRVTEEMRRLEASLVNRLEGGVVIVDGQIYQGEESYTAAKRLLGYTKTQAAIYLSAAQQALLHELKPYQRTPIFQIPGKAINRPLDVFSWYVRLPLKPVYTFYPSASLLRVETICPEPYQASQLADLSVSLFCDMASSPAKDPRAPQNLIPIGGLEQWLGRHLGQAEVARRRIMQALFN